MERLGRAIGRARVNIAMMRTFVQLRRLMDTNRDLARKIEALEKKYDEKFAVVFEAIKQLITRPSRHGTESGFTSPKSRRSPTCPAVAAYSAEAAAKAGSA